MRYTIFLLFILALQSVIAQNSSKGFYRIDFTDKGTARLKSFNPELVLSSKAIERRDRYHIAFDYSDLPLNPEYVSALTQRGAKVITRSRWFNNVVIEATPEVIGEIGKLNFVKQVDLIDNSKSAINNSEDKFPIIALKAPAFPDLNSFKNADTSLLNYGAAANQINMMKGEVLHNHGYMGQGMTIAVIDAGFNSADIMNAFDSLRTNNQIKGVHNFVDAGSVYDPSISAHGTMVLSTMGANLPGDMIGTAPKADYWLLRSEDANAEYILEEYYWVEAAEFADSVGANVINSSLGYTTFDDPTTNHTYADMDGNTTYITIGADKAAEKGILVVNSAGNSGANPWHYIGAPADGDSVFTIGAVDAFGNHAYFSSYGPTYDGRLKPTVSSQGQSSAVYAPWGLSFGSGTSFSSPIMAGISACLWQASPELNNMEIMEAIKSSSSIANQPDSIVGWGIPNFELALSSVLGTANLGKYQPENSLVLFPNPFKNAIYLNIDQVINGTFRVDLFDMNGKLVRSAQFTQSPDNKYLLQGLDKCDAGVYSVRVTTPKQLIFSRAIKL